MLPGDIGALYGGRDADRERTAKKKEFSFGQLSLYDTHMG